MLLFSMKLINRLKNVAKLMKKSPMEVGVIVVMAFLVGYGIVPSVVRADVRAIDFPVADQVTSLRIAAMQNQLVDFGQLPVADLRGPSYTMVVPTTAYNSEEGQTDSTPFITASGTRVRHGVVAANFLPIGTRVKIPNYYGDQIFVVEDRMNARYTKRMDIWMEKKSDALAWGIRNVTIEVYR